MAEYQYKAPDGVTHKFRGPAGLSQYDVDLYAKNLFAVEEPVAPVAPPAPKGESGFVPSIMRAGYQTGALFGDVLPAMDSTDMR